MRQSTRDTTPAAPAAAEDDVIVEAANAEQALAEVNARLGPDAAIVEAGKVLRGGLGGFFAREVVQLRARSASPSEPQPAAPPDTTTTGDETGIERLLAGLSSDVDTVERSFGDALRRQLAQEPTELTDAASLPRSAVRPADDPVARAAQPAPSPSPVPDVEPALRQTNAAATTPAPAPASGAAQGPAPAAVNSPAAAPLATPSDQPAGSPRWSADNLRRLGLPAALVDAVAGETPNDDAAWTQRLAAAIAPLCRPLPEGPMILAGPAALPLAEALALPVVTTGCRTPAIGSFAVRTCDGSDKLAWITACCTSRWLHVVVGGSGWRQLLFAGPVAAVSWVTSESLPDVLQAAADLGLPLGYEVRADGPAVPANPVDVAIAVRALLPRR